MKTAISIPDALFAEAEQFARQKGLSRSELYARAVELYLNTHRCEGVTEALNKLFADEPEPLDPAIMAAQMQAIGREEW